MLQQQQKWQTKVFLNTKYFSLNLFCFLLNFYKDQRRSSSVQSNKNWHQINLKKQSLPSKEKLEKVKNEKWKQAKSDKMKS